MTVLIDSEFLSRISYNLHLFKRVATDTYNFRCPLCGDSKTKSGVKRAYLFKNSKRDSLSFKCHRCTETMGFNQFLKRIDETLHKEYIFANVNYNRVVPKKIIKTSVVVEKEIVYKSTDRLQKLKNKVKSKNATDKYYTGLTSIYNLDDQHEAKKYLVNRKINGDMLKHFYFCEDFVKYVNIVSPGKLKKTWKEGRLIIPLINSAGEMFGFQGRSLDPNVEKAYRYLTIIFNSEYLKTFGLDRIDTKAKTYIVEGPFDSMFIDNCLAACGASIDTISADVYILDNEPRNKNIVNIMKKLLTRGKSIVILDPIRYSHMDINDMIQSGMTKTQVKTLIEENTYNGLQGHIKLKQWSKI